MDETQQATPAVTGTTIKPTPVTYNVTEVVVAPIVTTLPTDCNIVITVL